MRKQDKLHHTATTTWKKTLEILEKLEELEILEKLEELEILEKLGELEILETKKEDAFIVEASSFYI